MNAIPVLLAAGLLANCTSDSSEDVSMAVETLIPSDSIHLSGLGIFDINSLSLQDSSVYMVSRTAKEIIKTNLAFEPLSRYTAQGKGPGELTDPFDLTTFGEHVFVLDFGQRKIIQFNSNLEPISEFVSEKPPMSVLAVNQDQLWMGSFDMEFEDTYLVDMTLKTITRLGESAATKYPPEGIVDHARNEFGDLLRYRYFTHHADLYLKNGTRLQFKNTTQPEKPELDLRVPSAPVFKWKTHQSAFLSIDRACFLSGENGDHAQPIQCFSFDGSLIAQYEIRYPSKVSVYSDSTLYTYSPTTNHVYVYKLDF
jgi:hypothetical protein